MRKVPFVAVAAFVAVLGAFSVTVAPSSGQELRRFQAPVVNCTTVPPNATLTLGSPATTLRSASSSLYGTTGCDRYVVDFRVGPTTNAECGASGTLDISGREVRPVPPGGVDFDSDEATCNSWREEVTVYLRASGQLAFRPVRSFVQEGRWQQQSPAGRWGCFWQSQVESVPPRNPEYPWLYRAPDSGVDTYRVAVKSAANGSKRAVQAELVPSCYMPASPGPTNPVN